MAGRQGKGHQDQPAGAQLQRPGVAVTSHADGQGDPADHNGQRQANPVDRRGEQKGAAQAKPGNQKDSGKTMQCTKRGEQNAHPV